MPHPSFFIRLLLLIGLAAQATSALATSCIRQPFLDTAESGAVEHIVSFRVLGYEQVAAGSPNYMDVEVVKQFKGDLPEKQIRIIGNNNGLSVRPSVSSFDINTEWLQVLEVIDGEYYLRGCSAKVFIEEEDVVGYIRPCSDDPGSDYYCGAMHPTEQAALYHQRMSLDEFDIAREMYNLGISKALRFCTGPSTRCNHIRASYDPVSGELILPAVDLLPSPGDFPLKVGIQVKMQQVEGSIDTFKVTEIDR